jgi:hypothetical protein
LNGPKLRRRLEPAFEDKPRVTSVTGDDVLPGAGKAVGRIHAEEMAQGGLAESVEMLARPEEHRLCREAHAGLFVNLADRRFDQALGRVNAAGGNLRSCFGVIAMIEPEKAVCSLDVDDDSLPAGHPMIVGRSSMPCRANGGV